MIALNLVLVLCIAYVSWQARLRWMEAQAARSNSLFTSVRPAVAPPVAPVPMPDAAPAVKYADVATKDLFSKDRNPTVVLEPVKVEKPREMPALPVLYGVLGLPSGARALAAEKAGGVGKPVRAGDTVGEFKVVALNPENITLSWEGKEITRKVDDLMDRNNHTAPAGGQQVAAAGAPPPTAQAAQQQIMEAQMKAAAPPAPPAPTSAQIGAELGAAGHSERRCMPGDPSPAGSMIEGYKKVMNATPFGVTCRWIPAQ